MTRDVVGVYHGHAVTPAEPPAQSLIKSTGAPLCLENMLTRTIDQSFNRALVVVIQKLDATNEVDANSAGLLLLLLSTFPFPVLFVACGGLALSLCSTRTASTWRNTKPTGGARWGRMPRPEGGLRAAGQGRRLRAALGGRRSHPTRQRQRCVGWRARGVPAAQRVRRLLGASAQGLAGNKLVSKNKKRTQRKT